MKENPVRKLQDLGQSVWRLPKEKASMSTHKSCDKLFLVLPATPHLIPMFELARQHWLFPCSLSLRGGCVMRIGPGVR